MIQDFIHHTLFVQNLTIHSGLIKHQHLPALVVRLDGLYRLTEHLRVRLGVLDLELSQVGHALLAVRHPPLLLHRQLGLGSLGHLLERGARLLLPDNEQ